MTTDIIQSLRAELAQCKGELAEAKDPERMFAMCKRHLTDSQIANLFGERMTAIVNERDALRARVAELEAENRSNYQARCEAHEVFNRHDVATEGDVAESVEKLFQQLAAASADGERLDWLEVYWSRLFGQHNALTRSAIDAARKATP